MLVRFLASLPYVAPALSLVNPLGSLPLARVRAIFSAAHPPPALPPLSPRSLQPTRLAVTKTVDPDAVTPNVPVTYTVTITNTGDADAAAVTLRDELPTGLTPTDVSAEIADVCQILPDTPVEGIFTIFCEDLGLLAVNASLTVNYTASAAEVGVYTNEAEVRALDVGVVEPYTATAELTVAVSQRGPRPRPCGQHCTWPHPQLACGWRKHAQAPS